MFELGPLLATGSAVISPCETFRYRLDRAVQSSGLVFAYFGVNGSTATASEDDQTVRKWIGFTKVYGGRCFIVGNLFGFRARDVNELARCADPVGPDNDRYLAEIIEASDVLVPCWGSRDKLPNRLRPRIGTVEKMLRASSKPIKVFGFTKSGDPKHPLTLGYNTKLIDWNQP